MVLVPQPLNNMPKNNKMFGGHYGIFRELKAQHGKPECNKAKNICNNTCNSQYMHSFRYIKFLAAPCF